MTNHIIIRGDRGHSGSYVLWLRVAADLNLAFGRFLNGQVIRVPAGSYAYVGSAMGSWGASTLAGRLLRHATRTGDRPPQTIRAAMVDQFVATGLVTGPPRLPAAKRLHWHIDYLVDQMAVAIEGVTVIRTVTREESRLARELTALTAGGPLWPGLGASDAPGETHLFRLPDEGWDWPDIARSIMTLRVDDTRSTG